MKRRRSSLVSSLLPVCLVVVIVLIAWAVVSSARAGTPAADRPDGLPSGQELCRVKIPQGLPDQPIVTEQMNISFSKETHCPNYVAWELTVDEVGGSEGRRGKFTSDPRVSGCATTDDYRNSGFDRGHMMPAADAKWSADMMDQTFMLTNICPQRHSLNGGAWKSLEEKCRDRAAVDSALIIVCGPVPGDRVTQRIGATGVAVPRRFFKVIMAPYAPEPYAIGFIMPNDRVPGGMQAAATTVDEVERVTGMDFFSAMPDSLEEALESQVRFHRFSTLR